MYCFEHVRAIIPSRANVWRGLGHALFVQGDYEQAYFALIEARSIDPVEPFSLLWMGLSLIYQEQRELAFKLWQDTQVPNRLLNECIDYQKERNWTLAEERCIWAATLMPNSASAHFEMGLVRVGQGRFDLAIGHFQEAIALNSSGCNDGYLFWQGQALLRLGDYEDAQTNFEAALACGEQYVMEASLGMGQVCEATGDWTQAETWYLRGLEAEKKSAWPAASLGELALKRRDWHQALWYLKQAVTLQPDDAQYHWDLAYAYHQLGNEVQAVVEHQHALELNPSLRNLQPPFLIR